METYPGELLVGVFPLVFCVDATLAENSSGGTANAATSSSRTQFDRFLDAMAASLMDDPEGDHPLAMNESTSTPSKDVLNALLRNASVEDDDDDEILLNPAKSSSREMGPSRSFDSGTFTSPPKRSFGIGRSKSKSTSASIDQFQQHNLDTSYAKALQNGQGFFQRARIVSISARHGFPPSKDAKGDNNRVHQFFQGKNLNAGKLIAAIRKRPIDGILPSGWVGKHAHALPSVILVVVQVAQDQSQFAQDEQLTQTLENLQYSLAAKRECAIQIVGVVQEGVSNVLAEQWSANIQNKVQNRETIMLLNVSDLQQDLPSSLALQYLHKYTRQASFTYYANQAHRTRQKLSKLGPARLTPNLLPLSIRYCFKIAMFYEFQWRQQKSVKFMVEAYRNAEAYYRYLLHQKRQQEQSQLQGQNLNHEDPSSPPSLMDKVSMSNDSTFSADDPSSVGGEGVELALQTPNGGAMSQEELLLLKTSPPPEDMIYQCRKIADWLNFKIVQSGLISHTEGGLLAVSRQWQKHSQAFCSARRSFLSTSSKFAKDAWLDWAYVAHQRMVVSQLLERNPPQAVSGTRNDSDEILLRCSPWRTYEATAEAILRLGADIRRHIADQQTLSQDTVTTTKNDEMRAKYVGGLNADGHVSALADEMKVNHRGKHTFRFL